MGNKGILSQILFFVLAVLPLSASQKSIVLGGEKGWSNLAVCDGVTTGKGRFGFDSMELVTQSSVINDATDILITFDSPKLSDSTGHYVIAENHLSYSTDSVKGKGSALSRGFKKGLILERKKSVASYIANVGSFTMEFWLQPSLVENGEVIMNWKTSLNLETYSEYQVVSAVFNNNRLEWSLRNIFPEYSESEIVLKGLDAVVPGQWSRHTISYNEENGCIEYLVDGKTEDIKFLTSTGHENGTVCIPVIDSEVILEICPDYTGKIDNFRIHRQAYEKDSRQLYASGNEKYRTEGGRFISQPILVSQAATLDSVDAIMNIPPQTDIRLYVRSGDNFYGWTDNYPEWKEVLSGEEIAGVKGTYFQVSAELLPDGSGSVSPSVTQLEIKYTETPLPLPPFSVQAEPGDGQVTLTWSYSVDETAGGYYVYYGNKSGEYLGRIALEGASPVKAGNNTSMTLTGLNNGTIYYFAVSSYSRIDGKISGELSKEVYARPSKRLSLK